ncbi:MAG: aminotransferase class IV, partial [Ginsengibacter sp.]
NRGLRYGDGLFETMRIDNGKILNEAFHFDRLYQGLALLQLKAANFFTSDFVLQKVKDLLKKNGDLSNARVRLMAFRGNGELFSVDDNTMNYMLECWPLNEPIKLNSNGLIINVFSDARKACDGFSNLKSNNYLPFVMGAIYAKKNQLNDAIILNSFNRICESIIANIFIIKDDVIYTPPLSEGCVAGTVRRKIVEQKSISNLPVEEKGLTIEDVLDADEFFLTNAIHPIRWVKNFREKNYGNEKISGIFNFLLEKL